MSWLFWDCFLDSLYNSGKGQYLSYCGPYWTEAILLEFFFLKRRSVTLLMWFKITRSCILATMQIKLIPLKLSVLERSRDLGTGIIFMTDHRWGWSFLRRESLQKSKHISSKSHDMKTSCGMPSGPAAYPNFYEDLTFLCSSMESTVKPLI